MKKIVFGCVAAVGLVALAGVLVFKRPLVQEERSRPGSLPVEEIGSAQSGVVASPVLTAQDAPPDCGESLATPEGSSILMRRERRLRIEGFLDRQASAFERALVADLAGYRPFPEAALAPAHNAERFWLYAPPRPPGARRLSIGEFLRLEDLRQRDGIAGVAALGDASLFQALWGVTTYAGHVIKEQGQAFGAARDMPAVGLHELAIAVEAGVSAADFAALLDAADVDPAATWRAGDNLAKVAAIHNRPALLRLLIARGADAAASTRWSGGSPQRGSARGEPLARERSVLDEIAGRPRPASPEEASALADVVQQLVAVGVQPYLPSTLSVLAAWLPKQTLPALHPDASALIASLADAAAAVAAMDAEWTAKVDAAAELEERCEGYVGDLGGATGGGQDLSLAAKQRQQDQLMARARARPGQPRAGPGAPLVGAQLPADERRSREFLFAAMEGRWEDAIGVATELGNLDWLLLRIALSNAPLEALQALLALNRNALPPNAIEDLANSHRADLVEVAEALAPLGLDLHYQDALGRNAFSWLAAWPWESDSQWRFAEYLARHSVSVKPSRAGLDPLDQVLMGIVEHPRPRQARFRFARLLIDLGAPIEPSHLELAAQLAIRDEDAHRRLLRVVPELAS